jgi:SNF2 family DNA or RNA helicase
MLKLNVGVLAGTKIFGNAADNRKRGAVVDGINNGALQGLIMTDRVGGTGFTLTGASHMIFLGSSYSKDEEDPAIGASLGNSID